MSKGAASKEIMSLIKLISFFKQLRHKNDIEKTSFFFVNELFNIVPYRQCIIWGYNHKKISIHAGSGQIDVGEQSPFAQFLKKALNALIKTKAKTDDAVVKYVEDASYADVFAVEKSDLSTISSDILEEWLAPTVSNVFLYDDQQLIGGVWIERDTAIGDMEKAVLEDTCDALATRMQFFKKRQKRSIVNLFAGRKRKNFLLLCMLCVCFLPVRFSVTGTLEIVSQETSVISVPFSALISEVAVKPNQAVKEGELLFTLDKTQLQSEYNLALQELETARQNLSKTEREGFFDATKRSEINVLREEIKTRQLDVNYSKERLELSDVKASKDGVILFSDVNDLIGQPVKAGDKIMTLANPDKLELLVRMPSEDMIDVNKDVAVKFFLNTEPLHSHKAIIQNISYQPTKDTDGILSYKARAKIINEEDIERIGLTGTAKVYGERTVLIVNILRRPFMALRNIASF